MNIFNEEPFFFGVPNRRMYGVLYKPNISNQRNFGWIFCAPFGVERSFSHRLFVDFARTLCQKGYPVLRFDYPGTGDSEGEFQDYSMEDWIAGLDLAILELRVRARVECKGLLGLRFGATLASIYAQRNQHFLQLILWEPVIRGEEYIEEIQRAICAQNLLRNLSSLNLTKNRGEELPSEKFLTHCGFEINPALVQEIRSLHLGKSERPGTMPVGIFQLAPREQVNNDPLLSQLYQFYQKGGPTHFYRVFLPPPWRPQKDYCFHFESLFRSTLNWIDRFCQWIKHDSKPEDSALAQSSRFVPARRNGTLKSLQQPLIFKPIAESGYREIPVIFPSHGYKISGILHLPPHSENSSIGFFMTAPGYISRTMSNRLYVKIARALANQGFMILRYDPQGIGDSEGRLQFESIQNLFYQVQQGLYVPDTLAAVSYLRQEWGCQHTIALSTCGGAVTDMIAASHDPCIEGLIALDFPLVFSLAPQRSDLFLNARKTLERLHLLHVSRLTVTILQKWERIFQSTAKYLMAAAGHGHATWKDDREWYKIHLGPHANTILLSSLTDCIKRRIPLLAIFADPNFYYQFETVKRRWDQVEEFRPLLIEDELIGHTDHIFSNNERYEYLLNRVLVWLKNPEHPWVYPLKVSSTASVYISSSGELYHAGFGDHL